MAREAFCTRCDRTVYVSEGEGTLNCPVCSTPLIDAASGLIERDLEGAEPGPDAV